MKITRRARSINLRAIRSIEISNHFIEWNEKTSKLILKGTSEHDFSGTSKHNYEIEISISEFQKIISTTAISAFKNPVFFEKILGDNLKDFLKITSILGGIFINVN